MHLLSICCVQALYLHGGYAASKVRTVKQRYITQMQPLKGTVIKEKKGDFLNHCIYINSIFLKAFGTLYSVQIEDFFLVYFFPPKRYSYRLILIDFGKIQFTSGRVLFFFFLSDLVQLQYYLLG